MYYYCIICICIIICNYIIELFYVALRVSKALINQSINQSLLAQRLAFSLSPARRHVSSRNVGVAGAQPSVGTHSSNFNGFFLLMRFFGPKYTWYCFLEKIVFLLPSPILPACAPASIRRQSYLSPISRKQNWSFEPDRE